MTSSFFSPILGWEWLGADGLYFRIKKNLGSVGVRCLMDGKSLQSHSWEKGQQDLFRPV